MLLWVLSTDEAQLKQPTGTSNYICAQSLNMLADKLSHWV